MNRNSRFAGISHRYDYWQRHAGKLLGDARDHVGRFKIGFSTVISVSEATEARRSLDVARRRYGFEGVLPTGLNILRENRRLGLGKTTLLPTPSTHTQHPLVAGIERSLEDHRETHAGWILSWCRVGSISTGIV